MAMEPQYRQQQGEDLDASCTRRTLEGLEDVPSGEWWSHSL